MTCYKRKGRKDAEGAKKKSQLCDLCAFAIFALNTHCFLR